MTFSNERLSDRDRGLGHKMKQRNCSYLLTYSMVQSPSWAANWFAASQEIPRISWNPNVHYRTHRRPPPVYILGQPNPVHIPTSHLLEIHPNIIHPSTPRSPQWYLSLRFPHQDPIHSPLLTYTRHMPSPSHSSRFYHPHNIWRTALNPLKNRIVPTSISAGFCTALKVTNGADGWSPRSLVAMAWRWPVASLKRRG